MNILVHLCCGPCGTSTVKNLREAGHHVTGFFYNPNIHPYTEFIKRLEAVKSFAEQVSLKAIYHDEYELRRFLREVLFREDVRCRFCYHMRLLRTAAVARKGSFDAFTSTLFVSPHQDHELMKSVAEQVAAEVGVPFHYQDFREGYRENYELSKEYDLYRQSYCGCIFSEYERYTGKKLPRRKSATGAQLNRRERSE
ncbi:epoxyqueuosine reductase QueH [bacterium]|nr:epoxyqueuosine reductase QueH [bacterium]